MSYRKKMWAAIVLLIAHFAIIVFVGGALPQDLWTAVPWGVECFVASYLLLRRLTAWVALPPGGGR